MFPKFIAVGLYSGGGGGVGGDEEMAGWVTVGAVEGGGGGGGGGGGRDGGVVYIRDVKWVPCLGGCILGESRAYIREAY